MGILPAAVVAMAMFVLIAACRDPERGENGLASSRAALTGKEVFGTYERKGEPFSGAVASIALVPATCDAKNQAPIADKADGAAYAKLYTECAEPTCKTWKTVDVVGSYRIIPGEGNLAKLHIHLDWDNALPVFKGVIDNLNVKYTLFLPDGTPCRASVNLKMKQANTLLNKEEAKEASDKAKGGKETDDDGLAPSKTPQCVSAGCECAAQAPCAGTWACVDHGCVCQTKPQ